EIFRLLPWRNQVLEGMLGADLIGFHTLEDAGHFVDSASHLLDLDIVSNNLQFAERLIQVDAFPMGIDFKKYQDLATHEGTARNVAKLRKMIGPQKLMISVDRLDYTKGIPQRLHAFQYLLEHYPEFRENISFLQLVVPSRDHVPQYKVFKDEIDKLVSSINARFSTIGWTPIYYFYRSFPINLLSAVYRTADIALVTPMRDGMNLVAKEFVASKPDRTGVLVLSEMAGAAKELLQAIQVNPNDLLNMVEAMVRAIRLPEEEQKVNMEQMQQVVSKFDIHHWVDLFLRTLLEVKSRQKEQYTRLVTPSIGASILERYENSANRLIILDYDGTLVPFHQNIMQAFPDESLRAILEKLVADPKNRVAIISGRSHLHLESWFRDMPVDFFAEHGAWHKAPGGSWKITANLRAEWKPAIRNIMETFTEKTPGSSMEEKSFSLAWHYRSVTGEIGELRARDLCNNLKLFSADHGLQVLCGKKVVEVKNIEINKGNSVKQLLQGQDYGFILAVGDDATDEDMFRIMPENAVTIKVAGRSSAAAYFVKSFKEVRIILEKFASVSEQVPTEK
ncbi:MAG TPA: bifunctional alpha,alpha-trehalose-phosphate synthase (UDP-forming)/trehalose-phosphatase, partial [Chitinophagaceae bacterium]|nr:bifunctional alpha,alpha-trehalose-phosphate synthase (UDP-forming)/trehalose-phosphatase [Chitinophagaceae bacterium]